MEHANYEYNTRHGLEHMLDYWLRMIVGCNIWTHIPSPSNSLIAHVKSEINVSRWHFFADVIFSATSQKFKTIKIKPEKNPSIPKQIRAYYIFQGILRIFSNIYALRFIFSKL